MQYFRFAQQEPELFKLLFLSLRPADDEQDVFAPPELLERMKHDEHLSNLDEATLKRLFSDMWIYTHGLATLAQTSVREQSEEFARESLLRMGNILILWEQLQKAGFDPNNKGMGILDEMAKCRERSSQRR
jgi:hypothetical protein